MPWRWWFAINTRRKCRCTLHPNLRDGHMAEAGNLGKRGFTEEGLDVFESSFPQTWPQLRILLLPMYFQAKIRRFTLRHSHSPNHSPWKRRAVGREHKEGSEALDWITLPVSTHTLRSSGWRSSVNGYQQDKRVIGDITTFCLPCICVSHGPSAVISQDPTMVQKFEYIVTQAGCSIYSSVRVTQGSPHENVNQSTSRRWQKSRLQL